MKAGGRCLALVFATSLVLITVSVLGLEILRPTNIAPASATRGVLSPPAAGASPVALPPGASPDWWTSVQKSIRESEYQLSWQEETSLPDIPAAWHAANRAHNFRTYFTPDGPRTVPRTAGKPEWTWGMELRAWGPRGHTQPVSKAELSATGNRVEYRREGLTEWYLNNEKGLEQGFTLDAIHERTRTESDWIELNLSLSGTLGARIDPSGSAIQMTAPSGVELVRYGYLSAFDAAGRGLPARMELEGSQLSLLVDTRDALYPIVVDPLATSPAWTAEGDQEYADFGQSVATAGDVNGDGFSDVIVGAHFYDNGHLQEGRAFLYLGSASGLSVSPAWTAESNQASSFFGNSVATAGDVNGDGFSDVIVGACQYDNGQANEGRAYLYLGSGAGLDTYPAWTAEGDHDLAYFGWSVATAGDVDGDGYSDVLVAAYLYDSGQADEGRAYLYRGSAGGLGTSPAWIAESDQAGAHFGQSVATAGDVNGDGYSDVIVGASHYDNGQTNEGMAFLYLGSAGGLSTTAAWTAESDQANAWFGFSAATAGDVDGDGYSDVIVGARYYSNPLTYEGRAYLYLGSAAGLGSSAAWTAESDQGNAEFGYSVATAGDVNGDGYSDVLVGAHYYDHEQADEGRAFLYLGSATGLSASAAWTAESNQVAAEFGNAVATAGDVNGDGYSDVIAGAYLYTNGEVYEGRAFVYLGSAGGLGTSPGWTAEGNQAGAWFGYSVSTAGDVNGDGHSDVIVGAYWYDNGQENEGCAFLYLGSADGLSSSSAWTAESDQANAYYAHSVSTAGDVNGDGYSDVIVGADLYGNGQTNEGRAFLYLGSAGGLNASPAWTAESDQASAFFGKSVATAGDVNGDGYSDVLVGAHYFDNGQTDEGRAFLYLGSADGLGASASWTAESDRAYDYFGQSVATAGDVNGDGYSDVILGAPYYDSGQVNVGGAFLYLGSPTGLGASPVWTAAGDRVQAEFGSSVATAGDVNGDGYSDVLVGAWRYDNGQYDEGRAFLYLGSAGGPGASPAWSAEGDQTNAWFGTSVATAGDVNGDGYSDVIVGAYGYDNGETDRGRALLYLGSPTGLGASPAWTGEGDQTNASFGICVATAGDVNGDGYSDVVVGGHLYSNGENQEGRAFLYYGNEGAGLSLIPRQRRLDNTAPVAHLGLSGNASGLRVRILGRTPYGRGKIKLEWETKPLGTAFNGTGTTKSTSWTNTLAAGVDLNQEVSVPSVGLYHWRGRLLYHPATTPFQAFSRWISPFGNGWQEADVRVGANIELRPVDVFFPAPDTRLFTLRTNRYASVATTSPLPGGGLSNHSAAIAVFNDRQYIAVKGATDSYIYIKSRARDGSFADSTWMSVPGGTSSGPALCTFNGQLYLFVKALSTGGIFYRSMNISGVWSSWAAVSGSNTLWRPGLVVFSNRLYCFAAHASTNRLWYRSMDAAGTWTDWIMVPSGTTNATPTPVAHDGKIWLFVKGMAGKMLFWISTATPGTPSSWSPWNACNGSSEAGPGVALEPTENLFHLVVRGNMVPRIWHRTLDPATLAWGSWHLLTNLDPAAQSIDSPTVVPANW